MRREDDNADVEDGEKTLVLRHWQGRLLLLWPSVCLSVWPAGLCFARAKLALQEEARWLAGLWSWGSFRPVSLTIDAARRV